MKKESKKHAIEVFQSSGGVLRFSEARSKGIHPRTLKELVSERIVTQLQRGLYALSDLPNVEVFDYAPIVKLVPNGVICLTTALAYYQLTVQIPRWIDVAIPQKQKSLHISHPPTQFHWFSDNVFDAGIKIHKIGGLDVKMYSAEKTIIDCFRLRKKVGPEVAIEGLKRYLQTKTWDLQALMQFAKESRVTKIIQPIIEALIDDQS